MLLTILLGLFIACKAKEKQPEKDISFDGDGGVDQEDTFSTNPNEGIDNDQDGLIDSEDDDEFGPPRDSALKIASKKISENIISDITSTW